MTLAEAAEAIRNGRLRPSRLAAECLQRIERTDTRWRAWARVDRAGALRDAALLDRELDAGSARGPLHGIPIGVKDIIDVAGLPTRAGSPLRESHLAAEDAAIVSQLRAAGAVVLGKTVTTQFACFDPPETVNPHDASRTPGGSSSGSAVAVATQTCLAALGSQTGGSIIRPASYCGIVGFKPSKDRWSTSGVVPVSGHLDHVGPLTACVADLLPIWKAVVGSPVTGPPTVPSASRPQRFGLVRGLFQSAADPRAWAHVNAAAERLIGAEDTLESVDPPAELDEVLAMHRRIMAKDLSDYHAGSFARCPDQYAPGIATLIREGLGISPADYQAALRHRIEFIDVMERAFQHGPEFWITPATPSPAPGRETTGDPAFNTPWSYCGFPTVSIPCGNLDGLPVSLQLIAAGGRDEALLRVAAGLETKLER
ncbi:MAG: amidase [Planctomycetota bacterium]